TGATKLLPELDSLPPVQRRGALQRSVTDSQLSQLGGAGGMRGMSVREQRLLLAAFAAPLDGAAPGAPAPPPTLAGTDLRAAPGLNRGLVVGRRRQFRLEVTLAHGSITEASADAYVLGVFSGVAPAGAAAAVDAALAEQPGGRGPLAELISRRMISGGVGEITALPINRNRRVRADSILLAGLGNIAEYREGPVLETVGESVMRIALMSRLDDFAIVPIGASAGSTSSLSVGQLIRGFMKPLRGLDGARLRGFTICELDDQRYQEIRQTFYQLLREPLFDDVEITLTELDLPVPVTRAGPPAAAGAPEPVYLFVQQAADAAGRATAVGTMLTAGGKAAIIKLAQPIDDAVLDALLAQVVHGSAGIGDMKAFGTQLMRAVLHPDLLAVLARETAPTGPGPAPPLVVVHDAPMSRIPWEAMQLPGRETSPPALAGGLSHRYVGGVLSVAKWMEERQQSADLSILLVVNPTQDLPGAEREGDRIKAIVNEKLPRARLRELRGADARRSDLLDCFSTGEFDVVHYAGHAYFDPANRGRSGILCYNREVLSGADLAALSRLPALVVFNACESARVRRFTGDGVPTDGEEKVQEPVRGTSSFAESFLSGGIANYIGTYWEVQDASALTFGETLYARLLAGLPLGQALLDARNAVAKLQQGADDWADYVFYGDPRFVLKAGPGSPSLPAAGGPVLTAG
ncbi:MAG TPA: CHAT domain-containing protein, partial [Acetobacteraceae bacterium]|nr:CHAT domain-containing protein [Acetobacteraceae bacterium]